MNLGAPPCRKRHFWRRCRIYFRWLRITIWLVTLALVGALVYLNQVGLPGFVKRPLLEKLRARGIDLQFSRLRWRWYHGIVAENVRFGPAPDPSGLTPQLSLAEVQVRLNRHALTRFQLQVDALVLRRGRLVWPIEQTNTSSAVLPSGQHQASGITLSATGSTFLSPLRQMEQAPRQLTVENIQTELRLLPNDQWALDDFRARLHSVNIRIAGTITNASAVREWKVFHPERPAPASLWQERIRHFADTLERIRFDGSPDLKLIVIGDARELQSFSLRLGLSAQGADTPWGQISEGAFSIRLYPADSNQVSRADLGLDVAHMQTHLNWPNVTNLAITDLGLQVNSSWVEGATNPIYADLTLSSTEAHCESSRATNILATAHWVHSLTNAMPLAGEADLCCLEPQTPWGKADRLHLSLRVSPPGLPPGTSLAHATFDPTDDSWAWWANLKPYWLDWDAQVSQLQLKSRRIQAEEVACRGSWRAPALSIDRLYAKLYSGQLEAQAGLDVATRAVFFHLSSDFDPHKIAPLLTEKTREFLSQFQWDKPPQINAAGFLVLPSWTNPAPDWRTLVQPALRLEGDFMLGRGAFRAIPATSARSHFSYTQSVWRLPDLLVTRPEGRIEADYSEDQITKDFHWRITSGIDPDSVCPLLDAKAQRALGLFAFSQPPDVSAEIWGRWHESERIGLKGIVAATNFNFRGESVGQLSTALQYTNHLLGFTDASLQRGTQQISVASLAVDFPAQKIFMTNGFSTAEPLVIARAIGPHIARAIEPYRFKQPPVARVQGVIPLHGEEDADLTFDLAGGPFQWMKFNMSHVMGKVHWIGLRLTLTSMQADCYAGAAAGAAAFDFSVPHETYFSFVLNATNTQLHSLMTDLVSPTNHLEGLLSGSLTITNASTLGGQTWNGSGNVSLRDGLIWDIPIFGVFSPVLNGVVPGLGNSRASAATATFAVTNGVIRSDDLDIRCSGMRLAYRGTVDFGGRVNARVEAALLRDAPVFGPILSTVFWPVTKLFEYRVTGSLGQPNTQPLFFIPKVVLLPFHPLRTLKELFPEESGSSTNGLPPFQQPSQ